MPHNYTIQTLHQLQFTKGTDSFQISIYHFFFFQKLQDFGSSLFNWNSTETVVVVLLLLLLFSLQQIQFTTNWNRAISMEKEASAAAME